jgi:hypothetical protein
MVWRNGAINPSTLSIENQHHFLFHGRIELQITSMKLKPLYAVEEEEQEEREELQKIEVEAEAQRLQQWHEEVNVLKLL